MDSCVSNTLDKKQNTYGQSNATVHYGMKELRPLIANYQWNQIKVLDALAIKNTPGNIL